MSPLSRLHRALVVDRRARVLSERIAGLLPVDAHVLDLGCGDGSLARMIRQRRPDVAIIGIETIIRPRRRIPIARFDGATIPVANGAVDVVLLVDVLHHTEDPEALLREARRVARRAVILKDHTRDGFLAGFTLRLMDRVGNSAHGIPLPYNYWPERRWREAFVRLGLRPGVWLKRLDLYPAPARWLFDRSLHFIARLDLA